MVRVRLINNNFLLSFFTYRAEKAQPYVQVWWSKEEHQQGQKRRRVRVHLMSKFWHVPS